MKKSEIRAMIKEELLKEEEKIDTIGGKWSDDEKALIAGAINYFGDGQHPVADSKSKSLEYFAKDYVKSCLKKGLPKMSGKGKQLANALMKKLG